MTAINSPPLSRGGRIFTDFAMCNRFSKNLGLGEGSALPVGVPVPWPSANPPTGWLKCNGAAFTAAQYPNLALAYPTLKLPDLRGEFIRGWDDVRGIDAGRTLLSLQLDALQKMTGSASNGAATGFVNSSTSNVSGVFKRGSSIYPNTNGQNSDYQGVDLVFDSSLVARSAAETRPRNIAFNYIVRAA
ncbi:phage tail protein [Enterobacter chengduensis]|uniref:phage tail protein n=1 Tax=Enterobacter chengduensis TaxID=2494701 RepID=UPI001F5284A8|nr:phage tail protein [Enterobacter chengduensis]